MPDPLAHTHRRATARGCRHTKWHERMKRIKGKNDQSRRDGLRAASSISPGLSRRRGVLPPTLCGSSTLTSCCLVHVFGAEHVHSNVCMRTCACVVQFVKWNLNNTRPIGSSRRVVGSKIAYNNAFKIYSINCCWIRSSHPHNGKLRFSRRHLEKVCVPLFTIFNMWTN